MVKPAPIRFNPELLVRNPERLSVSFPLAQCKRLTDLLADDSGQFDAEFELKRVGRQLFTTGFFESEFMLECQRCLQPFRFPVKTDFDFALVADQAAADATADDVDPVVLGDDGMIHVVDLFEDELILQIPAVPKHQSPAECDFAVPVIIDGVITGPTGSAEKSGAGNVVNGLTANPNKEAFAVLKNIRFSKDDKK